jgi:hypothetical protein
MSRRLASGRDHCWRYAAIPQQAGRPHELKCCFRKPCHFQPGDRAARNIRLAIGHRRHPAEHASASPLTSIVSAAAAELACVRNGASPAILTPSAASLASGRPHPAASRWLRSPSRHAPCEFRAGFSLIHADAGISPHLNYRAKPSASELPMAARPPMSGRTDKRS